MRKIIKTDKAPAAIGPYSQAIVASGSLVFTAGQIPMDPLTGQIVEADIVKQSHAALKNLVAVLKEAGADVSNVAKTTVFLKSMDSFVPFNEVYAQYFGTALPARSAVEVARLPKDVLVEIEAIAVV